LNRFSSFTYNGSKGSIGFSPKINAEDYKSAFITAEGWGSYLQNIRGKQQENSFNLTYGTLRLKKK
jgi:non-lysosomal glucosylceramidase